MKGQKGRLDFSELHGKGWAELTVLLRRRASENQSMDVTLCWSLAMITKAS